MAGNNDTKQLRNYILVIDSSKLFTPTVVISPSPNTMPNLYTLEFEVDRNIRNEGRATFRIYNLSQKDRTNILRDVNDTVITQNLRFYAGYGLGTNLPLVFSGDISSATTTREGVNVITTIDCFNATMTHQKLQYTGGALSGSNNNALSQVCTAATTNTGLSLGAIGPVTGTPPAGQSHYGTYIDVLNNIAGSTGPGMSYIDNRTINVLGTNQYIINQAFSSITSATGLLDAPYRQNRNMVLRILFEPRLMPGQSLTIDIPNNAVNSYLNGPTWKISDIQHRGTISPVVSGELTTTISFQQLDIKDKNGGPIPTGTGA